MIHHCKVFKRAVHLKRLKHKKKAKSKTICNLVIIWWWWGVHIHTEHHFFLII